MKSYKVTYADGLFQYMSFESEAEAKAWRSADSVKSVKAGEPPANEPPPPDARDVADARETSDALDRGLEGAARDLSGPEKEAAAKARKG